MRIIYLRQNHKRTDICMRGTKRGRLPRYIIIILLRFISTLFYDPIFNTLSQFSSLLDINSTAYSTRLLHTTSLLFLYTDFMFLFLSLTRFLLQEKFPVLLKTDFPFPITMTIKFPLKEREKLRRKKLQTYLRTHLNSNVYFSLLVEYN